MPDRRRFLQALAALGVAPASPAHAQLNTRPRFAASPFTLGVASGYPQAEEFAANHVLSRPSEAEILERYSKAELR